MNRLLMLYRAALCMNGAIVNKHLQVIHNLAYESSLTHINASTHGVKHY